MSYTKHHTEGIVLKTYDVGEAGRRLALLTPDLGLVFAHARGVRQMKSKQRFALQTLSHILVSLVHAKNGWRITNVSPRDSYFGLLRGKPEGLAALSRITTLVRRLVRGEEGNTALFKAFAGAACAFTEGKNRPEDIELLAVLRILFVLGYLPRQESFEEMLHEPSMFSADDIARAARLRRAGLRAINDALAASQL